MPCSICFIIIKLLTHKLTLKCMFYKITAKERSQCCRGGTVNIRIIRAQLPDLYDVAFNNVEIKIYLDSIFSRCVFNVSQLINYLVKAQLCL